MSTGTTIRLLVVDDDETFRRRVAAALRGRGFEVSEADSAESAIEKARAFEPSAALVDLRMPGASGLELVSELVALSPEIRVVVLTGYGSIATAVEALKRGAIGYLTKPIDLDSILRAFDGQSPHTQTPPETSTPSLEQVEWEHINRVLVDCGGNISLAAKTLGIHRRSLQRKLSSVD